MRRHRRHSPEFKLHVVQDIRSGAIGRREAVRKFDISSQLIQLWLEKYDAGELESEETLASIATDYEAKIAALERKVGQLTMELDLLKKSHRQSALRKSASFSVISGPQVCPSEQDADS